jgi:hypothetical protein
MRAAPDIHLSGVKFLASGSARTPATLRSDLTDRTFVRILDMK